MTLRSLLRPTLRMLVPVGLLGALTAGVASGDVASFGAPASADGYRIVLSSNRDGAARAYSMLTDGSRLAPLLPPGRRLVPVDVSANGRTIAYSDGSSQSIYVSRGNGAGLRRLVRKGRGPALSRDGRFLAYTPDRGGVAIVRTNGSGRKRLMPRGISWVGDWSPNGRALVYGAWNGESRYAIVVLPLHGKRRVLVRVTSEAYHGVGDPVWSPDGRWIAYRDSQDDARKNGLWVVRPNGAGRHRVTAATGSFAWSPDGRRLAVSAGSDVLILGVDGRVLRRVRTGFGAKVAWSPDGRALLLEGGTGEDPAQIWLVGAEGMDLRQVTSAGSNSFVGWTRMAPARPPAAPLPASEKVVDARTVETRARIAALSADGAHVAFVPKATRTDCEHVAVWRPGDDSTRRFVLPAPCAEFFPRVSDVELAGSRVAWALHHRGRRDCDVPLKSATFDDPVPKGVYSAGIGSWAACRSNDAYHLRGDGELLVFDDGGFTGANVRLVRIGAGSERCHPTFDTLRICATLRRGELARPADSVSGRLIAIRRPASVAVLDDRGELVRRFLFSPANVSGARLDGDRLVVARAGVLEVYNVATGALQLTRSMPAGYRLVDVDGGVAVLLRNEGVMLVKLDDGRSRTFEPGGGPVLADLEPAGLYYSYPAGKGGRLSFVPRSELL
jgi:Tol biopolymer transport system component